MLMSIPWPSSSQYSDAIQNPDRCFLDADLRQGTIVRNRIGLPDPRSGQFAVVYQIAGAKRFAVKCFTQQITNQQQRYAAISQTLSSRLLPLFVQFAYLDQGIRISGNWFPVLKMEWVSGELLSQYVERNAGFPQVLKQLAADWQTIVAELHSNGIAHGDLQCGNIKVSGREIKLVDYDGMFIPSLLGNPPTEIGSRHFQHPQRTKSDYNDQIDNFSALVIYLSLLAIAAEPALWRGYHQQENLILSKTDFETPGQTPIWRQLESSPDSEVRRLVAALHGCCRGSVSSVPPLPALLGGAHSIVVASQRTSAVVNSSTVRKRQTPWYLETAFHKTVAVAQSTLHSNSPALPWYHQADVASQLAATGPPSCIYQSAPLGSTIPAVALVSSTPSAGATQPNAGTRGRGHTYRIRRALGWILGLTLAALVLGLVILWLESLGSQAIVHVEASGQLDHLPSDGIVSTQRADVALSDFGAEATFFNPYGSAFGRWSYGFLFRDTGANEQYRVFVTSDGTWRLILIEGKVNELRSSAGGVVPNLDLSPRGFNTLRLTAAGDEGLLYVNETLVARIDLGAKREKGDVLIASGLEDGDEIVGATTRFRNFVVAQHCQADTTGFACVRTSVSDLWGKLNDSILPLKN